MSDGDKGATGASGVTGVSGATGPIAGLETDSAPPGSEGAGVTGPGVGAAPPPQPNPQTPENAAKAPLVTTDGTTEDGADKPVAVPNAPFSADPAKANRRLFRAGDAVAVYQPPATDPYYATIAQNEKKSDDGVVQVYRKADDITVPVDTNVVVVTRNA